MGPITLIEFKPRPFGGVFLEIASKLDAACPGTLNSAFYGSGLSRQARFFAYARIATGSADEIADRLAARCEIARDPRLDAYAKIARSVTVLKAEPLIGAVMDAPVPAGLLGLLKRCGSDPLPPDLYQTVWALFAEPRNARRVRLLQQTEGIISAEKIRVAARLDDLLVCKAVFDRLHDSGERLDGLHRFIDLVRVQCNATDEDIRASLSALPAAKPGDGLRAWAARWVERQVRLSLPPPFPAEDADLRLCLGAELTELGQRFRNCAGTRLCETFLGQCAIYEFSGRGGPAIVEMVPLQSARGLVWACEDFRTARNAPPSADAISALREKLDHYGWLYRPDPSSGPGHKGLAQLLEHWGIGGLDVEGWALRAAVDSRSDEAA